MWEGSRIKSVLVTLSTVIGRDMRSVKFLPVLTVYLVLVTLPTNVLIPVYDVNTDKRFLFPEEYLRLILEEQALILEGKTEEIAGPLDKEGYVINEDGQLIPIKIYKKGGSRLHPRNCRGGFHKRELVGLLKLEVLMLEVMKLELTPREADNVFEVEVYKRQLTRKQKIPVPATRSFKLSKLPDSSEEYPNFDSWSDDTGLYQNDDVTNDDRFSFLMDER